MSYNPYGNDGTAAAGSTGDGPPGPAQPWEPGEVLKGSVEIFKAHWASLVIAPVIAGIVFFVFYGAMIVYMLASGAKGEDLSVRAAGQVLGLVSVIILPYFEVGLLRMWLTAARGQTPDVAQVFSGFDRYPHMLTLRLLLQGPIFLLNTFALAFGFMGVGILDMLLRGLASLLAAVLGVFLALGLYYADFFVADQNLNPVDALKRAWLVTQPFRTQVFLFSIICAVITVAATFCCGLPIFAAIPIVMVASATVFLRVTGQGTPSAGSAFGTGFAGGGYTPPPQGPSAPF